jgi:transcriptional regulator with XRE-family HTH domain
MTTRAADADRGSRRDAARRPDARTSLGNFLRTQRRIAGLSLRQLADITSVSNAYLSQIERNLHRPSVDVLRAVARGLNVSAETLLDQVGLFEDPEPRSGLPRRSQQGTEAAILADHALHESQREALLAVYRSYVAGNAAEAEDADHAGRAADQPQAREREPE